MLQYYNGSEPVAPYQQTYAVINYMPHHHPPCGKGCVGPGVIRQGAWRMSHHYSMRELLVKDSYQSHNYYHYPPYWHFAPQRRGFLINLVQTTHGVHRDSDRSTAAQGYQVRVAIATSESKPGPCI
jgi:hypothetical protein